MRMSTIKIVGVWLILSLWAAVAQAGTHHHYYTDPQGTVLAKTDAQGNIIAMYDYAPYGTAVAGMSPAPNGPGYTGHVNDPDSGLVYMQARYYDPAVGRFLSVDPVGLGASVNSSFNRYSYATNNPIALSDPTGAYASGLSGEQIACEVYHCESEGSGETGRAQRGYRAAHAANAALQRAGVLGKSYQDVNNLVTAWSDVVAPITERMQVEIGSDLMRASDKGFLCSPAYSTGDSITIVMDELADGTLSGRGKIGEIHAHPWNASFSGSTAYAWALSLKVIEAGNDGHGDLGRYYGKQMDGYVALPNGAVYGWKHQPFTDNLNRGGYQYLSNAVFTVRGPTH
jgi:RHS repeat-associated protein